MKIRAVSSVLLVFAATVGAQETHAGHAAATLTAPLLGTIEFPVTASPESQNQFIRGVLFLHNFHYDQAADAFQQAEKLDPSNVMAYWGEAMTFTHPVWNEQDTVKAHEALAKLGATREERLAKAHTPRERMWFEAVEALYEHGGTKAHRDTAYSAAMQKVFMSDTTDIEARAFYALSLLGLNQGNREAVAYRHAYDLLAPVFNSHPKHPGIAHYIIHSVDDPDHAHLGVKAADAYSEIAPAAGHALHMTSHIYLAIGRWDDVLDANVRANATLPRGLMSGHSTHWLHYSLVQLGRYREADHWLDSMLRQAKTGPEGRKQDSWNTVGIMAAANIVDTHRFNTPAASMRVDQKYFNAGSYNEAIIDLSASEFGYAVAALENGKRAVVDSILAELSKMRSDAASDPAKKTSGGYAEVTEMALRGLVLEKDGKFDESLKTFHDASTLEASLPMPFGPPVMIKPPRELAGELLLKMKRPAEAKAEFVAALARTPLRTQALLGLARSEKALGDRAESRKAYQQVLAIWHKADSDLPELAEVRAGAR